MILSFKKEIVSLLINNLKKLLIQHLELPIQMKLKQKNLYWILYLMVEAVHSILIKFILIEISNQNYQIRFLRKIKKQAKILVSGM